MAHNIGIIHYNLSIWVGFYLSMFFCFVLFCFVFAFSRAAPGAYGGSQARGRIGAIATSLHQGHGNSESELRLQPIPQLTATPDP